MPVFSFSFTTLHDVQKYAELLEEYPDIDNEDWLNPDYTSFHQDLIPSRFERILMKVGLRKQPLWSVQNFEKVLRRVVPAREKNAYLGRFIQKIIPTEGARFFIFGDVHGAFHSLVRDLVELKNLGVIDEQLKIIAQDDYFVFNGNVVDRSPFILETLTLVLTLMQVNPNQVIYIRGKHEDKEHWHNYGLRRELEVRARSISSERIPLQKLVTRFFNTLPLALYLIADQTETAVDVVRISNYSRDYDELNEKNYAGFLADPQTKNLSVFKLDNKWVSTKSIDVKVIIKTESRSIVYRPTSGLQMIERDKGSVAWTLLSSPTRTFRQLYEFFYDAFAVLTVQQRLEDWTLALYNRDVRERLGFSMAGEFNLLTGLKIEKKEVKKEPEKAAIVAPAEKEPKKVAKIEVERKDEIVIGTSLDLSKGMSVFGKQIAKGLELVINDVNKKGGIRGKKINLIVLDDEYVPQLARANVEKLLRDFRTNVLLSPSGSATLEGYIDLVKEGKVLVAFTDSGAPIFRVPDLTNIIHFRSSYVDATNVLTKYAINELNVKKIAFFYQNDAYGQGALEGARKALKNAGIKDWMEVPYTRNDISFIAQVKTIEDANPDAIIFLSTAVAAREFIKNIGVSKLKHKKLLGLDFGDVEFKNFIKEKGLSFTFVNMVPNPQTSQLEIVKEFRKSAKEHNAPVDIYTLEAYINASIFVDILKKVSSPITKEKILQAARDMHDYDFKGLKLNFDSTNNQISNTVWLDTGNAEWIPFKIEPTEYVKKEEIGIEQDGKIVVGTSLDLSKGLNVAGKQIVDGLNLVINKVNQQGGIKGKKINLVVLDDEYIPQLARANVEKLLDEFHTNVLLSVSGSATLEGFVDLVKSGKVLVVFTDSGAPIFRKPDLSNIIHFRASYLDATYEITMYAIKELQAKKFVFFYQDDAYGQGALEGARKALKEVGIKDWVEVPYTRNDVNFERQIRIIEEADPDSIGFLATTIAARELMRTMGYDKFAGKVLFGLDFGNESFKKLVKEKGLSFIFANMVPNPKTSQLEIVKEFREAATKNNVIIDIYTLESYINADIFVDMLRKIDGAITKDKILQVAESFHNYDFKGLKLNFDPSNHQISNIIWLDTGKDKWLEIPIKPLVKEEPSGKKKEEVRIKKKEEISVEQDGKIIIGTSLDLSKGLSLLGRQTEKSLNLVINNVNQAGGIAGKKIDLIVLDDGYSPHQARANVEKLLRDFKTNIVLSPSGSPTLGGYIDLVKEGKVLVAFTDSGAPFFRTPDIKNIIHFKASYADATEVVTSYVIKNFKSKKIALFYQDDAFGRGALEGAQKALKDAGMKDWVEVPYKRNDVNFERQIKIIEEAAPDAIGLLSTTIAARELMRNMGFETLSNKVLFGIDFGEESFMKFIREKGLKFVFANMVPNPKESNIEIVKEFREDVKKNDIAPDIFALEAYINARIFVDILKKIKGIITKEKIIEVTEGIHNYDFKGLKLNFDPNNRQLSNIVWLDIGKDEWLSVPVTPKKEGAEVPQKKEVYLPEEVKKEPASKDLVFGSTIDLTRGLKVMGSRVKSGLELAFNRANENGGVNDKKLRLIVLDDGYTPSKARDNVEQLYNSNIDILLSPLGSPTLEAYLDLVKEDKLLVLFPVTGAPAFRTSDIRYIVNFKPSYADEARILVDYAIEKQNARKILIFYQNDVFGLGALEGAREALKKAGVKNWIAVPYKRNDVNFLDQKDIIEKEDPDTILFFATSFAAQGLIRQVGAQNISTKNLLGLQTLGEDVFKRFAVENGLRFITSSPVPNPETSQIEIVKEYRNEAKKEDVPIDPFALEGYINAQILIELIKKIKGPVTKEAILNTVEQIKDYDFKGLKLNFNPATRELSNMLWLDKGLPEWKAIKVKQKEIEVPAKEEEQAARKNIVIGTTLDLSKGLKVVGERIKVGLSLVFDKENNAGGIDGKKLDLIVLDDEYNPKKARENVELLVQKFKVDAILGPVGAPTLSGYLDLIRNEKLLVLFPMTAATNLYAPDLQSLIFYRPSYFYEGLILTTYMIETLKVKDFIFFYQNDVVGLLDGAREALKRAGITKWLEVPYARNDVNFDVQIEKIKNVAAESLGFFSASLAARGLIQGLGVQWLTGKKLFGISDLEDEVFKNFVKEKGLELIISNVFPNPKTSDLEIMKEFRADVNKRAISGDIFVLEGYIDAYIFIDVVRNIKGTITKKKIIEYIESMHDYDFKGLKLTWDPTRRSLSHTIWIDAGKKDWVPIALETGEAIEREVKKEEVREGTKEPLFGATLDLSKGARILGMQVRDGLYLRFDRENEIGGIDGKRLELVVLDDGYDPSKALANVKKLRKNYGIDRIISPVSGVTIEGLLNIIKDGSILVLFPTTGTTLFYQKDLKHIVHFRPSYFDEGRVLTKYMVREQGAKKFLFFYQADIFGRGALEGARVALKEAGINEWFEVPYSRNDLDFSSQVSEIQRIEPDSIGFFSTDLAAQGLIRLLDVPRLSNKKLFGISDLGEDVFKNFIKEKGLKLIVANVVPSPKTSQLEIVKAFRQEAQKNKISLSTFSLEAYIDASILIEALKKIKAPFTNERILTAIEGMTNYELQGLSLNFEPSTRTLSKTLWLDIGSDEWLEVSIDGTIVKKKEERKVIRTISDEGKIVFGTTLDLSKGIKIIGKQVKEGLLLRFDQENEKGGIRGKKLDLIFLDDEYVPNLARLNIEKLMTEFNIPFIISPVGSPTLKSYLDLVIEGKIGVFLPLAGGVISHRSEIKNLVFYRPSYLEEGKVLTKHILNNYSPKKFLFFYQNDVFGWATLEGATSVLKENGIKEWSEVSYERNDVNFEYQIAEIKKADPDAVGFFSTDAATKGLIRQMSFEDLTTKKLFGISDLGVDVFKAFLKEKGLSVIIANVVPNPKMSMLSLVEDFRKEASKVGVPLSTFTLEAYLNASIVIEALKKITGPITKEKIVEALEEMKNYDLGGIKLDFDSKTRELSDVIWLDTGESEWVPEKIEHAESAVLNRRSYFQIGNRGIMNKNMIQHKVFT